MSREELITAMVMDAIADDYEDFEMVVTEVTRWAAERGIPASQNEIAAGLTILIQAGLAKAYLLSAKPTDWAHEVPEAEWRAALTHPAAAEIPYYFYLTDEGKRALKDS